MAFTAPTTRATDFLVTAAIWNAEHVDNMNTAWPHLVVRKPSDESVANTTLQADDHLILPVAANEVWLFRFFLVVISPAAADFAMRLTFPASAEVAAYLLGGTNTASFQNIGAAASPTSTVTIPTTGTTRDVITIDGTYHGAGNAGNVTLEWAQGAASGTTFMKANSTLWAVKLA